jgi:type I restriction enzyme, S subunit
MNDHDDLPRGWVATTIEDLFEPLVDGRTLHQGWSPQCEKEPAAPGEWGVLKTTAIQAGAFLPEHNKKLPKGLAPRHNIAVAEGDLLITCAGPRARCGIPCLVRTTRPKLMMSGKMYRFRVARAHVIPPFIEGQLLTATTQAAIDKMKTGGSDSGLNLTHERFRPLPVLLAPLAEQQRLVEAIDSYFSRLDDAVATLERVQTKLKAYRASVLKAAVEGRLVPTEAELARAEERDYEPADALLKRILAERRRRWEQSELAKLKASGKKPKDDKWKAKYVEPVAPDTRGLPELPEGWCWATVAQLASGEPNSLCDGPFGSNLKTEHYTEAGPRVVRLQNIGDGEFLNAEAHIAEAHFQRLLKHKVIAGDLLVASLGTDLPRACVVPASLGPAIVKADCLRFAVDDDVALPLFVMHALNSPSTRSRTEDLVHGVGRPRIGLTLFRATPLPLPPRAEQARIVDRVEDVLSVTARTTSALEADQKRCARLRQAVLKWAFEGKLVDQDPNDEPAQKLLERIRAEREAALPARTTKKKAGRKPKKVPA